MTDGFISYWTSIVTDKPGDPAYPFAKKMVDKPKVVFTKTLEKPMWANTSIAKGDLAAEISKLKNQAGKDIIVYGGAGFDSSLIKAGLIDEFYLFINPSAIGKGLAIFRDLEAKKSLILKQSIVFDCGIVLMNYEPGRD